MKVFCNEWMTFNQYSGGFFRTLPTLCLCVCVLCSLCAVLTLLLSLANIMEIIVCSFVRLMQRTNSSTSRKHTHKTLQPTPIDKRQRLQRRMEWESQWVPYEEEEHSHLTINMNVVVYFDLRYFNTFKSKFSLILRSSFWAGLLFNI